VDTQGGHWSMRRVLVDARRSLSHRSWGSLRAMSIQRLWTNLFGATADLLAYSMWKSTQLQVAIVPEASPRGAKPGPVVSL